MDVWVGWHRKNSCSSWACFHIDSILDHETAKEDVQEKEVFFFMLATASIWFSCMTANRKVEQLSWHYHRSVDLKQQFISSPNSNNDSLFLVIIIILLLPYPFSANFFSLCFHIIVSFQICTCRGGTKEDKRRYI